MSFAGSPDQLLAYVAIPKTGSVTLAYLLRRHFAGKHVDVLSRYRDPALHILYRPRDLRIDLKLYPFARSLAGHALRPFIDYEEFEDRLVWYTILRNPVDRYISQYQYMVRIYGKAVGGLRSWMQRSEVDGVHNWQVRKLAGKEDLQAAKQMLATRFRCVGLFEHYNESLLILRQRLGLQRFNVSYAKPLNVARESDLRRQIMEHFDEYRDEIIQNNKLDIELYDFVLRDIWPRQLAEYGEEKLKRDIDRELVQKPSSILERWRWTKGFIHRNLVYKPFVYLDCRWNANENAENADRGP